MNERQQIYLAVLREHGSAPKARQAAGVTRRTVANWEQNEAFAEAAAEAQEGANDAILQRARDVAMAGDPKLLSRWMRALIPALQPKASQVAVGVKVNAGHSVESRRAARFAQMSDAELLAEMRRLQGDIEMRLASDQLPAADIVDVQAIEPVELPAPASVALGGSGEAAAPSAEN